MTPRFVKTFLYFGLFATISLKAFGSPTEASLTVTKCDNLLRFNLTPGKLKRSLDLKEGTPVNISDLANIRVRDMLYVSIENALSSKDIAIQRRAAFDLQGLPGGLRTVTLFKNAIADENTRSDALHAFRSWKDQGNVLPIDIVSVVSDVVEYQMKDSDVYLPLLYDIVSKAKSWTPEDWKSFAVIMSKSNKISSAWFFADVAGKVDETHSEFINDILKINNGDHDFLMALQKLNFWMQPTQSNWLEKKFGSLGIAGMVGSNLSASEVVEDFKSGKDFSGVYYKAATLALNTSIRREAIFNLAEHVNSLDKTRIFGASLVDSNWIIQGAAPELLSRFDDEKFEGVVDSLMNSMTVRSHEVSNSNLVSINSAEEPFSYIGQRIYENPEKFNLEIIGHEVQSKNRTLHEWGIKTLPMIKNKDASFNLAKILLRNNPELKAEFIALADSLNLNNTWYREALTHTYVVPINERLVSSK